MGNASASLARCRRMTVHPHAHGERDRSRLTMLRDTGSSPRTWGTRRSTGHLMADQRFIPTHMGNAPADSVRSWLAAVHPHAHGERRPVALAPAVATGSSPRTWGTQGHHADERPGSRFIPTHMGNAGCTRRLWACLPVHPHAHGERNNTSVANTFVDGSSPRTWGTLLGHLRAHHVGRFIPTHMGNAGAHGGGRADIPVHPHAHGERIQ